MTPESSLLSRARQLRDENNWGNVRIAASLGISRQQAERLLNKLKLADAAKVASTAVTILRPAAGLPALSFYDTARNALAQAKTLGEVKDLADKATALKEYARRARDRAMEIDAAEIRVRAEAAWGRMALEAGLNKGSRGQLAGRKPSGGAATEPPEDARPTLSDMGVDKKFSVRAQKLGKISERAIEARLEARRHELERGEDRVTIDILKPGPSRSMNRVEAADSLDPFFTPPWATRALMEHVFPRLGYFGGGGTWRFWEPACGEGHMCSVLEEYFNDGFGSDVHDYQGNNLRDFLTVEAVPGEFDWIITNPPFRGDMAERFCLRALDLAGTGVAMFVALQFLETVGRYTRLFKERPPTLISFFAERVPCLKGRWDPDASTDAAYVWLVWVKDRAPMAPFWIPPGQREALTKPDDRARFAAWSMKPAAEAAE